MLSSSTKQNPYLASISFNCWLFDINIHLGKWSISLSIAAANVPSPLYRTSAELFQTYTRVGIASSVTRLGHYWKVLVTSYPIKIAENLDNLKNRVFKVKTIVDSFWATIEKIGLLFIPTSGHTYSGIICAFHPAVLGSNPNCTNNAFSICSCLSKNQLYGFGPYFKKNFSF